MIKSLVHRWRCRKAEFRRKARAADVQFLWPAIWKQCGGDPVAFLSAACWHTTIDPAWRHFEEWDPEPGNPGRWVAAQVNKR